LPGGHVPQTEDEEAPATFDAVPAEHRVQLAAPAPEYVPAAQGEHVAERKEANVPGRQAMQTAGEVAPATFDAVPATQEVQLPEQPVAALAQ